VAVDAEEPEVTRDACPEPTGPIRDAPGCLIAVRHGSTAKRFERVLVDLRRPSAHALIDPLDRPDADGDAPQFLEDPLPLAHAQAEGRSEVGDRRLESGTEVALGHVVSGDGDRALAAARAENPMKLVLRDERTCRGNLPDLLPNRSAIAARRERSATLPALGRKPRNDAIDLAFREQGPVMAFVAGLAAALASGGLALRGRLGPGRIRGRRPR